jgi:hypothetical protein
MSYRVPVNSIFIGCFDSMVLSLALTPGLFGHVNSVPRKAALTIFDQVLNNFEWKLSKLQYATIISFLQNFLNYFIGSRWKTVQIIMKTLFIGGY